MTSTEVRVKLLGVLSASLLACSSGSSPAGAAPAASAAPGDGGASGPPALVCHADRPATPFTARADGGAPAAATPPGGKAPVACITLTGQGASESTLGFAHDGTVFFGPATTPHGNGVVRSRDDGKSWEVLVPKFPGGGGHTRLEPYLYVDPADDHVYFATSKLVLAGLATFKDQPGIHLTVSADEGATWSYSDMAPQSRDWVKIFGGAGPAGSGGSAQHAVYFSSPSPIAGNWGGFFPPPDKQYVYRSLDAGHTWQPAGTLDLNPANIPGCSATDYVMFGAGVVAPDGTAYLGYRKCTQLALAASHDEGQTWTTLDIPGAILPVYNATSPLSILGHENAITGEPVAVDSAGNLYAVWQGPDDRPYLSVSRDAGATWSAPVVVLDPSLSTSRFVAGAVKTPGTLAIAYLGSEDGTRFDGYITETANALDPAPTFWSAPVSEPADPLFPNGFVSGYDASYFSNGGDAIEFVAVKYSPSGDPWASFVKNMCPNGTGSCTWDYAAHASSRFQGAAGILTHPR